MAFGAFKVLSITPAAAERVQDLVANSDGSMLGVRIGVKNGGCAGMEYVISAVSEPDPADDMVEELGATVFVEPKATLFLLGTTMGYEVTKFRSGFTFENPNQSSACGCGESVTLTPVDSQMVDRARKAATQG